MTGRAWFGFGAAVASSPLLGIFLARVLHHRAVDQANRRVVAGSLAACRGTSADVTWANFHPPLHHPR